MQGINRDHFNRISNRTSDWDTSIVYPFLVKKDGGVVQTRPIDDPTGNTKDQQINLQSVAIAYLNNWHEGPTEKQYESIRLLIQELKKINPKAQIIRHSDIGHTSPTSCAKSFDMSKISVQEPKKETPKKEKPVDKDIGKIENGKKYLWRFYLSRYYSPLPWQPEYKNGKTYEQDRYDQFWNDPDILHWADWPMTDDLAMKVAACPPGIPMWAVLEVQGRWQIKCYDRWSAIQGLKLDIYCWIGYPWLQRMKNNTCRHGDNKKVYLILDK